MKSRLWFCLLAAAAACGPVPSRSGAPAVGRGDASEPASPELRLPRAVVPELNRVRIALDPAAETFRGHIDIEARVTEPVSVFWLNADRLSIEKAIARIGDRSIALAVLPQPEHTVGFRAAEPIPAGKVTISIDYRGALDDNETRGIFRQKERADWYAFTQFESTDARRAFPCVDEPDSKVPWQLTLEVPAGVTALSNTPVASTTAGASGSQVVTFEQTPPLPSYLVAFAVGPFDIVDAGTGQHGTPIRAVVPRGRGRDTSYVVQTSRPILTALERYFGMPYPYAKLDLVAIPITVGFGAMENPGLVTFRQDLMMARPSDRNIDFARNWVGVAAHELAHQWFGDLVTMVWWDDIWLNEAFATWMGYKIVQQLEPAWSQDVELVRRRSTAMAADMLHSARKIRQPVESYHDIESAFDGITYGKGASVISMFERWLGEPTFQAGVRAYMKRHAWGNATAGDFLASISEAADKDVTAAFTTFLDRVGAPLIEVKLACDGGRPRAVLSQQRYLPLGSAAPAAQTWSVPVCVSYAASDGGEARDCTLLGEATGEIELSATRTCPAWLLPNHDMAGYYRFALGGDLLRALIARAQKLSVPVRVGLIGDVKALVEAGKAEPALLLDLIATASRDRHYQIVKIAAEATTALRDLIADEARPAYARFVQKTFGARARKLGWTPRRGESEDTRLLRNTLLAVVTDAGDDAETAALARKLAQAWLADRDAVHAEMVELVLIAAARHGDEMLWRQLADEARRADDRKDRQRLLVALGSFREPQLLARSLDLVLSGEFDHREAFKLLVAPLDDPRTRGAAYDYIVTNYDRLVDLVPEDQAVKLVKAIEVQCDRERRAQVTAFFGPRTRRLLGGPRAYAQAIEKMDLCIARRAAHQASIERALAR